MYKVAVLGKRADVLGFMALGFRVEAVNDAADAAQSLRRLAAAREYAVIFVCEDVAVLLKDEISKYSDDVIPAIIPIPTATADSGYGMNAVTESVIKAVGADVL
ncbi:MAG: V-type ATP synthase subunit F [Clostridia bacterium]|nr:V-type ATP synthase subunit F [Clostridia bacterium]MBP5269771.1 V-type ATP synthase subunit F [Clostridia bacterium]